MLKIEPVIRARRGEFSHGFDIICFYGFEDNQKAVAEAIVFKEIESRFETTKPFLEIRRAEAQILMDDLWECGLRPSEGTGSAGAMRAVEKHLEDMKTIAFHSLKIQK